MPNSILSRYKWLPDLSFWAKNRLGEVDRQVVDPGGNREFRPVEACSAEDLFAVYAGSVASVQKFPQPVHTSLIRKMYHCNVK